VYNSIHALCGAPMGEMDELIDMFTGRNCCAANGTR